VSSFYYGSLLNPKREEYQQNNVSVITQSVNISDYFNNIDSDYWGFDARKVPINGKIWYPEDKTDVSPLVLCVHGNHDPFEYSEFGYAYLGEMLASRGIIFATIDENFLNGSGGGENDARAVLLLIHTHEILKWNEKENIPLYKKSM
jgi:hypothetical protein